MVVTTNGLYFNAVYFEWFGIDRKNRQQRHAGVQLLSKRQQLLFRETIRHISFNGFDNVFFGKNIYVSKGTQIVQARYVVVMFVRKQYSVDFRGGVLHHLLPKIGSAIDDKAVAVYVNADRGTQAFVFGIGRCANLTGTVQIGNTNGGARS